MNYFESDVPQGNGRCSDNACPCPEVEIMRGSGYLYVDQELVDFRKQYPSLESAREAMRQKQAQMAAAQGGAVKLFYRLGPILVCEQGAKLRNLDLQVAAADAAHWWHTGLVPLRATPKAIDLRSEDETITEQGVVKTQSTTQGDMTKKRSGEAMPIAGQRNDEAGICTCEPSMPLDGFICERCGKAVGWRPVILPPREKFTDLTCAKCPDILIPGKAVYLLEILGKSIPCPLCRNVLFNSKAGLAPWDLSFLHGSKFLDSEQSLLDDVKRVVETAKEKIDPIYLAKERSVPVDIQLAGRLLLKWIEDHSTFSVAVIDEIISNWMTHIPMRMIFVDTFKNLSDVDKEGFFVLMHYASAFIHQVDARMSKSKAGHRLRSMMILNMLGVFWDYQLKNTPYDGRLALEELIYSIKTDKNAYAADKRLGLETGFYNTTKDRPLFLEDASIVYSYKWLECALYDSIPPANKAHGCRKSIPHNSNSVGAPTSKNQKCFVATAVYSEDANETSILRWFRDEYLVTSIIGIRFIRFYSWVGPKLADFVLQRPTLRYVFRLALEPFVWGVDAIRKFKLKR